MQFGFWSGRMISKRALDSLTLSSVLVAAMLARESHAQFVPNETEVCPASARVTDPEFDRNSQQMAYFDGAGALRVAPVAPDGSIASAGCLGTIVSKNVVISLPGLPFKNGPEWAGSQRGRELYFTRADSAGRAYMARVRFSNGAWRGSNLADSTDRGLALVSDDATDAEPRLVYMHTIGNTGNYELAWREAGRPETEAVVPGVVDTGTGGAPRWLAGSRTLTLGLPDSSGTRQATLYDVDTGMLRTLTTDAGHKDHVWLWPAPEFAGALAMMTVVDGCCLRFYREVAGIWQVTREIKANDFSRRPLIFSPEPVVYDGRSFVVMQLASQRIGYSEIWMVEMAATGLPPLLLSDPARRNLSRTEPEWMVTPSGLFVYVTVSDGSNRFALNLLKTPLTVQTP
jgi:hypothetical protein